MVIINESGFLKYRNLKFRCALGKAGIKKKRIEGDNITPMGNYKNTLKVLYKRQYL